MRHSIVVLVAILITLPATAHEILLPVFAFNMPDGAGTAWSSEVYVTNTGIDEATVSVGPFLPGRIDDKPPCETLLQPFVRVPPRSTVLWKTGEINAGIGCPGFAAGGLLFYSDRRVTLTSRMVKHEIQESGRLTHPLSGQGQEIDGVDVLALPKGEQRMVLPSVGWHWNPCGPRLLETNVFFTNPSSSPVRIEIDGGPQDRFLTINGIRVGRSYVFVVEPGRQTTLRLAYNDSGLAVCGEPRIDSFTFTMSGPVSAIASVIDRRSGDPRTSPAIPLN